MNRTGVGRHEFGRATDGRGPVATGRVREASHVLAEGVEEFIFADVFSRSSLGAREREMATVAVLAAIGGADNQLAVHVPAALRCGADPDELVALCEQIAPYAGFPRALNALRAVRAVLEEQGLPLPLPAERVDMGDHETLVTDVPGEGEPLVLVHSLAGDRRMWRDVVRALPPGRRVVAYDLRGHGQAALAPPPADVWALAAALRRLLDGLGIARARVAGISLGGCVAQCLALEDPARVSGLALVATFGRAPSEICRRRAGQADTALASLARWMTPQALAEDGWAARYLRDRLLRVAPHDWAGAWNALATHDVAGRLGEIGAPVRVVVGAADPVTPPADSEALAAGLPSAELVVVPGGPHMLPLEMPGKVARLIA